MLYREALIWKRLMHANIVPFIGVTLSPLQIMSEWMPGGELTAYIKYNPHASRVAIVSPVYSPETRSYFPRS
jgi:serine/threonine protein kinase